MKTCHCTLCYTNPKACESCTNGTDQMPDKEKYAINTYISTKTANINNVSETTKNPKNEKDTI